MARRQGLQREEVHLLVEESRMTLEGDHQWAGRLVHRSEVVHPTARSTACLSLSSSSSSLLLPAAVTEGRLYLGEVAKHLRLQLKKTHIHQNQSECVILSYEYYDRN